MIKFAKKVLKLICGVSVFSAFICFPLSNSFASTEPKINTPEVRPGRLIFDKCKRGRKFTVNEDIYAKARNLFPNKTVDVYITPNRIWRFGTTIDVFVASQFDLTTDSRGRLSSLCPLIWQAPLTAGFYDIVVDVDQDGTYNQGDAVFDRTEKPAFKVID